MKRISLLLCFLIFPMLVFATNISDRGGDILGINADGSINAVSIGISTSIVIGSSSTLNATVFQGINENYDVNDATLLAEIRILLKNVVISSGVITSITAGTVTVNGIDFDIRDLIFAVDSVNVSGSSINIRGIIPVSQSGIWKSTVTVENFPAVQAVSQSGNWKSTVTVENVVTVTGTVAATQSGVWRSTVTVLNTTGYEISKGTFYLTNQINQPLEEGGNVVVTGITASSTTNNVTIYPATTIPVSVTLSSMTSDIAVYQADTVTIADERYEGNSSTHTAGKLNVSGNIPNSAFNVTAWAFFSDGSSSTVTGLGGTSYCLDRIGNSSPPLELSFASPTIVVTLGAGATFYWELWGTE